MAIELTIEAYRSAISGDDRDLNREALASLADPEIRRSLLETRMDTTEMSDEEVETELIVQSNL